MASFFIFPPTCVCGFRLGSFQQSYEDTVRSGRNPVDVLNEKGVIRTCCRTAILNPPRLFANDADANRIMDDIGLTNLDINMPSNMAVIITKLTDPITKSGAVIPFTVSPPAPYPLPA
jgi:DNA-directed RNA polymerase subunit N (RpoN/RPB10)